VRNTVVFLAIVKFDIGKARVGIGEFLARDPLFEEFVARGAIDRAHDKPIPSPSYEEVNHGHAKLFSSNIWIFLARDLPIHLLSP